MLDPFVRVLLAALPLDELDRVRGGLDYAFLAKPVPGYAGFGVQRFKAHESQLLRLIEQRLGLDVRERRPPSGGD